MPIVKYHQVLERVIDVEVTEEQLAAMRNTAQEKAKEREEACAWVADAANCAIMDDPREHEPEFVNAIMVDENGHELFSIG